MGFLRLHSGRVSRFNLSSAGQIGLLSLAGCLLTVGAARGAEPETVATFSIVGYDPATGELGVAVESKFFSVGSVVPWARAGMGAVATQSYANTQFGPRGLHLEDD